MLNEIENYKIGSWDIHLFHSETGIDARNHPELYLQWMHIKLNQNVLSQLRTIENRLSSIESNTRS